MKYFFCEIQTHNDDNLEVLPIIIIEVAYAFGVLLILCELCERNAQAFADCSATIQRFNWYLFPAKIQRRMPMILNFTQQPVEIKCFGNMPCNRDTFKHVSVN